MTDLREMLQNSVLQYGKRDAFRLKTPDGGVRGISYEQLQKDLTPWVQRCYT
jgi:hypothetical protein